MTSLRFLFKDSVIYGGAIIINAIFMLLTIPILTKNLTVNEYGIVDLFLTLLTFLVIIGVFITLAVLVAIDKRRQKND